VVYFGLLTSNLGGGATLGMRALGLRLVRMNGRPAGLIRAIWRAIVLQTPFMLNGLMLPADEGLVTRAYGVGAITLVFGVLLAQTILFLFNWPSRRLVHDLLSGTAMVRRGTEALPPTRSLAQVVAFGLIGLVFAASLALAFLPTPGFLSSLTAMMAPLTKTQHAVMALPEVSDVGVQDSYSTFTNGSGTTNSHTLIVSARVRHWPKDQDAEVARIGEVAAKSMKLEPGQNLRVVLRYGYDIGIASSWRSYAKDYAPAAADATPSPETPPGSAPKGGAGEAGKIGPVSFNHTGG
jgi:hypothetical protein